MTKRIFTTNFCEPFIDNLIKYIEKNYLKEGKDLNRLGIVFGGKRPALFVKRELAKKLGRSFNPPKFFTIDDFIKSIIRSKEEFTPLRDLEHSYLLYRLVKLKAPLLLNGRESFAEFLPWAREILSFMDQLDLENLADEDLIHIEETAEIGYAVPEAINKVLKSITEIRDSYHQEMLKEKLYSRGFQYLRASELIKEADFSEFDEILVCNFFYFNRCEINIFKTLYTKGKATLIFQGDERKWSVLADTARTFDTELLEGETVKKPGFDLKLYAAYDMHSEVSTVSEILKNIKALDKTVIVLPGAETIIPLLSEIAPVVKDYNISMGYPLRRSSLYTLLEMVFNAQLSRKGEKYYTKDILKALRHPLVKNLHLASETSVTRILIHKIEEVVTGQKLDAISGCIYLRLADIIESEAVISLSKEVLEGFGVRVDKEKLKDILKEIFSILFTSFEGVKNFKDFSVNLAAFLSTLNRKSPLRNYPFNLKITARMMDLIDEMDASSFISEDFPLEDIFKIFDSKVTHEIISFAGSPLKGLQILGLLETRSLNFENVIVLDTNEGVLPKLDIYKPLIPREVMISLKMDSLRQEEEIQRYQFMRLISSAKHVHLIYQENKDKAKSRYAEELIFEEEKEKKKMGIVSVMKPFYEVNVSPELHVYPKTEAMIKHLRNYTYSASSINLYLRDPVEFYFTHVLGLKEREDLLDEPENREIGIFVHELLEYTFKGFVGKSPVIDERFIHYFNKIYEERFHESFGKSGRSDVYLIKAVLDERLKRFLEFEAQSPYRRVKEVLYIEKSFSDTIPTSCGEIKFKYKMDRVDRLEHGEIMILDYKTGSENPMPRGLSVIEEMELSRENIFENIRSFQMPLYCHYLQKAFPQETVNAGFYSLRGPEVKTFIGPKNAGDRGRMNEVFLKSLDFVMSEIFNPKVPFGA